MEKVFSVFGLTAEQACLLTSLQRIIVEAQVHLAEKQSKENATLKRVWLSKWSEIMNDYITQDLKCAIPLLTEMCDIKDLYRTLDNDSKTKAWKYMILLECSLFAPFYPIGNSKDDIKKCKDMKIEPRVIYASLKSISDLLEVDPKYINLFQKQYKSNLKSLSNYWLKFTITISISVVVILIATLSLQPYLVRLLAPGLYGAAATAHAMAILGGGAITAGGFGMAGGYAVLVAGGILIGGGTGAGLFISLASTNSQFVLSQAAKLQVVLKEIIIGMQHDTALFQDILLKQQHQVIAMKAEVEKLKQEAEKNKEQIKNLEKSITYLEKLIKNI